MHLTYVIKKNGTREEFQPEKINQWGEWACRETTANWSMLITHAIKKMYDGATTSELQKALIGSAIDLIEEDIDYDIVAARLLLADTRKRAYGDYMPPNLKDFYKEMVSLGKWDDMGYSDSDLDVLEIHINHSRDDMFSYSGLKQMCDKYLMQTRDRLYETPQFLYMGMSMEIFKDEPLTEIMKLYDIFSFHKVNVPTPVLVGLRSPNKGLASCCVIKGGDKLQSINAAINIAYTMTAHRAGIGMEMGIRSEDDPVRGGLFHHLGKLPYYKLIDKTVKANCYSKDTEIMTENGWELFSELDKRTKVAQVLDNKDIEFVNPISYTKEKFKGSLLNLKKQGIDQLVTPNHNMIYRSVKYDNKHEQTSEGYLSIYASDFIPSRTKVIDHGGCVVSDANSSYFSSMDQLRIAFQADGNAVHNKDGTTLYRFGFKKDRKILRMLSILEELGLVRHHDKNTKDGYSVGGNDQVTTIRLKLKDLKLDKDFNWVYKINYDEAWARNFIDELRYWDGDEKLAREQICFNSSSKESIDTVQYVAASCSYRSHSVEYDTGYRVYVNLDKKFITSENIKITEHYYDDYVYCVEVPTHRLIVRRNGYTSICGNTQTSRGGSATVQFNIFDPEIESLLRLKSQRVSDERRIDKLDYSVAINDFFLKRFIKDENITLFSIYDVPEVYELFFSSETERFADLYMMAEKDASIPKQTVKARDIFSIFFKERLDTGRIYAFRADVVNIRSTYLDKIYSSNLCQEITEPTKAFSDVQELYKEDGDGEVALCNLAAIVAERVADEEYEEVAYLLLKMIDNIISIQEYPYASIGNTAKKRRNAGIGLINIAYGIAKNNLSYESEEGRNYVHKETEKYSYWLHRASVRLAKEKGRCEWFDRTKYSIGILPIDTYPKSLDDVCDQKLMFDWESLRKDILKHGMRNSALEAIMPSETSSVVIGATNAAEPIRNLITYKSSSTGTVPFIVPEYKELKDKYEFAFKVDNKRYAEIIAIMQKFVGQSISYNEYYDYSKYLNNIIPIKDIVSNFMYAAKLGIKTFYYLNSDVDNGGAANQGCDGGSCTL